MAEFLVFNKTHWYDLPSIKNPGMTGLERNHSIIDNNISLTSAQKIKAKESLTLKYNARYQMGDIVEVREDGYWSKKHGFSKTSFALVTVKDMSFNAAKYLMQAQIVGPRRRYKVDLTQISLNTEKMAMFDKEADLEIIDKSQVAAIG